MITKRNKGSRPWVLQFPESSYVKRKFSEWRVSMLCWISAGVFFVFFFFFSFLRFCCLQQCLNVVSKKRPRISPVWFSWVLQLDGDWSEKLRVFGRRSRDRWEGNQGMILSTVQKTEERDFPGGPMVGSLPTNSGNMGLILGLGGSYMLWSN